MHVTKFLKERVNTNTAESRYSEMIGTDHWFSRNPEQADIVNTDQIIILLRRKFRLSAKLSARVSSLQC